MSDRMYPVPFERLIRWIDEESAHHHSIFGIPLNSVYRQHTERRLPVAGGAIETPVGPAAGPHTQMANNLITAYLCGGRFLELKTVQILDELTVEKPCIDARDEAYNVEWSQELKLEQSFDEYLKAWLLTHLLHAIITPRDSKSAPADAPFIFNMSVGYNLEGIKTPRVDAFIEQLKNAERSPLWNEYRSLLIKEILAGRFAPLARSFNAKLTAANLVKTVEQIPSAISGSITLSTMHGCPAEEIESIATYLLKEKHIHTFIKLNPTLLGFGFVHTTLQSLGYRYVELDPHGFEKDLSYALAVPMIQRLQNVAAETGKEFGIKLSNTLACKNHGEVMPGGEQYLSGRALFPLTINLAAKLADSLGGDIRVSYSGGMQAENADALLKTGIYPLTAATDLLKPGGYLRLKEMAEAAVSSPPSKIDIASLKALAADALTNPRYKKESREIASIKVPLELPLTDCYIAPCTAACPVHQDVPDYINLVKEGRRKEALALITDKNALPHITAYICDHQCMYHCTRWDYDDPVRIRDIKKEAVEKGFEEFMASISSAAAKEKNGARVAIIGAGPSGLAAASFLSVNGFNVTVFEKEQNAGGVVRNIIPQFRIPQEVIEKDIALIKSLGVSFVFGTDPAFSVEALKAAGFKYVYIAIGAGKANELHLDPKNGKVIDAVQFLWGFNHNQPEQLGKRVAVVGGGNSAMDSARAAKRSAGVEEVSIIYRRAKEQMPADKEEFDAAMEDGVKYLELLLPVSFDGGILRCQKMRLGEKGTDGRRSVQPIDGAYEDISVDTVITAIGELVDTDILRANAIAVTAKNKPAIDERTRETTVPDVFIGGDASRGPSTVIESAADGRAVAKAIAKREGIPFITLLDAYPHMNKDFRVAETGKIKGAVLRARADIASETERCLNCNILCNKCVDVCPNRANVAVALNGHSAFFKDAYQILHIDDLCNECGNCQTFCPYEGAPYKEKPTLYSSLEQFRAGENPGFYFDPESRDIRLRHGARESVIPASLLQDFAEDESDTESPELRRMQTIADVVLKRYPFLLE